MCVNLISGKLHRGQFKLVVTHVSSNRNRSIGFTGAEMKIARRSVTNDTPVGFFCEVLHDIEQGVPCGARKSTYWRLRLMRSCPTSS